MRRYFHHHKDLPQNCTKNSTWCKNCNHPIPYISLIALLTAIFAKVGYCRYSPLMHLTSIWFPLSCCSHHFLKFITIIGTKTVTLEWKIKKLCQISYLSWCTSTWQISAILRIALAFCDRKSKAFWQNHKPYLKQLYPKYLGFKLLQSLHSSLSYV